MAEDQFGEQIIPGTYIRVQAEALISAGGISAGNIGIVGTAGSIAPCNTPGKTSARRGRRCLRTSVGPGATSHPDRRAGRNKTAGLRDCPFVRRPSS